MTPLSVYLLGEFVVAVPAQALDNFLSEYNTAQAVLVVFVLSVLGVLPLKSQKVFSLTIAVFGLLFALIPISTSTIWFRLLGIVLVILAPLLYVTARE